MEGDAWIASIAVLGTLGGAALGALATFKVEEAKWAREERERLREHRLAVYMELLDAADGFNRVLNRIVFLQDQVRTLNSPEEEASDLRQLERMASEVPVLSELSNGMFRAVTRVRLFGSMAIHEASSKLSDTMYKHMDAWTEEASTESTKWNDIQTEWGLARANLLTVIRDELGTDD